MRQLLAKDFNNNIIKYEIQNMKITRDYNYNPHRKNHMCACCEKHFICALPIAISIEFILIICIIIIFISFIDYEYQMENCKGFGFARAGKGWENRI